MYWELAHLGETYQVPMNDLTILLKFQLFNYFVCSKKKEKENAAEVASLPQLPLKEPRTYNWPSRQEAIKKKSKKKSNTWGALRSNFDKGKKKIPVQACWGLACTTVTWVDF